MNRPFPFWQDLRKLLVDRGDGTHAERVEAYPPAKLLTDDDGDYARVRVDVGQTGVFAGREAYTFYDFSIPAGTTQVIKVVAPIDTITQRFAVDLLLAAIEVELVAGGTEGGTFGTALPVIKSNTMTTASTYAMQVTMHVGGTHTGSTVVDVLRTVSGTPANRAVAASASEGFPAGTYYIRLINTDGANAIGVFRARWEERP